MINRAGIFGPSQSGKTTLAKALSAEYWNAHKIKSLVLDPWLEDWGKHAVVMADEEKFWASVWASTHCLVIVEEATQTINRDRDLTKVFTAIRHQHHKLIVVGHSGSSLLPVMRQQLETLFLFLQSQKSAQIWVEETACPDLIQATTLGQFEFLHYQRFKPVKRLRLPPP